MVLAIGFGWFGTSVGVEKVGIVLASEMCGCGGESAEQQRTNVFTSCKLSSQWKRHQNTVYILILSSVMLTFVVKRESVKSLLSQN